MRRSEILKLRWEDIDLERGIALVNRKGCAATGSRSVERVVPLSKQARKILEGIPEGVGRVFDVTPEAARSAFDRSRRQSGLEHLRFHDLRHVAISRMWGWGMDALQISAASGHRDLKMLMRYSHFQRNTTT